MKNKPSKPSIGILGLWHLGLVYAASFAKLGFHVTGFDFDSQVINNLNKENPPIFEPGLTELLKKHLGRNLFFLNKPQGAIVDKQYVFICLDTPIDKKDRINLKPINQIFNYVLKYCSPNTTIVISSQIPIGTSRLFLSKLKLRQPSAELICFPENLRLGKGIETFIHPDRIILGSENNQAARKFANTFSDFKCPILYMSLESAEMVKHALNTFLALNISFASEMGDLCEILGADLNDVVAALKTDNRISTNAPIKPGLGFSGGTLGRDIQSLMKLARMNHYKPRLLRAINQVNQERLTVLLNKIKSAFPSLSQKNIGILGLTYKPYTNTLRGSLSLKLADLLKDKKAQVIAFDPSFKSEVIKTHPYIKIAKSIPDFFKDLDIIILMTEWPEFKRINPHNVSRFMKNKIIFDTKNFLNREIYYSCGFTYYGIGYNL